MNQLPKNYQLPGGVGKIAGIYLDFLHDCVVVI